MNRRLAPAILGVLVLLLACTDLIGPRGGNSVRLVVQPSFGQVPATAAADNPASRVDNVHVVLLNAAGATVLDTIIEWPLNQDTLRMDLDVVVQERESFELTIQGRSGDRVLFQAGPMSLELSEDDSGSTVATSPVLEYAGPGAEVAGVEITGAPGTFVAGSAVELGAVGTNDDGSDAGDLLIVWTSLNPDAATVGDDGRVQVGHDASRAVSIEGRVAFTTIADTIGGPVLPAELSLSPDASTLTALGAELSLTAALLGEDGGNVTGVDIEWSVADASVLELATDGDGGGAAVATARTRGATRVFATAGELTASADVTVEQTVARLEVDPDSAALARVNTNLQATATAFDANDNEIEDAEVTWSSGDPDVATVADDGTITAVSPGTARITAASDEAADSLRATVANAAPEVAITTPSDGATFEEGDTVTFEATAEDLEDGDLSASIEWVSDNPGELGTGASVRAELEPGAHTVTATVVDAHGDDASASMAVTVNPNTAPIVSITAPSEAITVSYGTEVALEAAAEDEQDGDLSSSIEWISDLDGELGAGASVSVDDLSIGNHTITASASDSRELTASATRSVEVTNNAPEVAITAPADGATYEEGASVVFQGAADDVEDGTLTGNILWSSDLDGDLGAGASATAALSNGTHTVTATVTDTDDATTSAFVKVTVNPNTPPTVSITAPSEATAVSYGTELTLEAAAGDEQDGDLSGSIEWSSDLDGELGAGARVVAGGLSIGAHTITASVSDSRELTASATRRVEVTNNAPEVEITAPADGATYEEGASVTFQAAAEDVEDGDLSDDIMWSSDLDGELGGGASATAALSNGTHTITATVVDAHGDISSAAIAVKVNPNTAPTVSITAPSEAVVVSYGTEVTLEGTADDEQDGDLSETIEWNSDLDGVLGTGARVVAGGLSIGAHTITASVSDSHELTASATRSIEVTNNAPEVEITAPDDGATYEEGASVTFEGVADDVEDGDLDGAIEWSSSMDGGFGKGPSIEVSDLSIGIHTITVSVKDSHGATGSASLDIEVLHPNGIGGTVFYASAGLGEVTVELVEGETAGAPAAQTTTTDADGAYTFPHVADGEYWVKAYGPSDAFVDWLASGVTVDGSSINLDIDLPKVITLLSPEDGAQVAGQPVLEWEENPDAASYTVQINATDGFDLIEHPRDISTNSYTVQAALEVGESYTWQVDAYGSGRHVGTTRHTFTFRIGNSAPAAVDDEATANENESVLIDVLANDSDPDGDDLTLGDFTQGDHGSVDAQDGQLLYTPDEGFSGADEFTYQISDGNGGTSTATVTVTVNAVNHAPTAVDDNTTLDEDASVLIDVLANDTDADGDALAIGDVTQGESGSVIKEDGQLLYTPDLDFNGTDSFTYEISDGNGGTDTGTVTVTVNSINDLPSITITEPKDPQPYIQGATITFSAEATDVEDDNEALTASITWSSDTELELDGGGTVSAALPLGTHTVTARVEDSDGEVDEASVTVEVVAANTAPTVSITPSTSQSVVFGTQLEFTADPKDAEDPDEDLEVQWFVDDDENPFAAGTTTTLATQDLILGPHTVRARVVDSHGRDASTAVGVTIENPGLKIVEPQDGALLDLSTSTHPFRAGLVKLNELGADSVFVPATRWSHIQDGEEQDFEVPQGFEANLPLFVGTYTVKARIGNSESVITTAQITVTATTFPTLTIDQAPTTVAVGEKFALTATASDEEDGDVSDGVTWSAQAEGDEPITLEPDEEGMFSFSLETVSIETERTYVVTASVTDAHGATTTAEVDIVVSVVGI